MNRNVSKIQIEPIILNPSIITIKLPKCILTNTFVKNVLINKDYFQFNSISSCVRPWLKNFYFIRFDC